MRRDAEETERMMKERINKLEATRLELDEEISHLKATAVTERLNYEEQLLNAKKRIKAEEVYCIRIKFKKEGVMQLNFTSLIRVSDVI